MKSLRGNLTWGPRDFLPVCNTGRAIGVNVYGGEVDKVEAIEASHRAPTPWLHLFSSQHPQRTVVRRLEKLLDPAAPLDDVWERFSLRVDKGTLRQWPRQDGV